MSAPNGNGSVWWRIGLAVIPLLIAGVLAFGALRSDVRHLENTQSNLAPREVVEAQYAAILRELQSIQARLDRMERTR
jgi:hypothetical protein